MGDAPDSEILRKLEELEARLSQLQADLKTLRSQVIASPKREAPVAPAPATLPAAASLAVPQPEPSTSPAPFPPKTGAAPSQGESSITAGSPPREPPGAISFEMKLGRQIFDKIALLALLFGVAFFLKYAFDRGWISDSVKILGGTALGYAL